MKITHSIMMKFQTIYVITIQRFAEEVGLHADTREHEAAMPEPAAQPTEPL